MKFLLLNTDYPDFLHWLYARHPGLKSQSYEQQMQARNDSLFGVADFYATNLRNLGHEAWDIHVNNEFMQGAWAREHALESGTGLRWQLRLRRGFVPWVYRRRGEGWFYDILAAQIKHYQPDVLLNHDPGMISNRFLKEIKPYVRLLVGQIASPIPETTDFGSYDLIVSSLPNFVAHFQNIGVSSELLRFAFEPKILDMLPASDKKIDISFVGSLSGSHSSRGQLLEFLCRQLDIQVYGPGVGGLPKDSTIRRHYQKPAWGIEMYQILHSSKMTLNHHIGIAESYANNMRLFEATGAGTMLITDEKRNLHELFEASKELITYRTPQECAELIRYYQVHDAEREAIAHAGQQRTLNDHTYGKRMQELVKIVESYLHQSETTNRKNLT